VLFRFGQEQRRRQVGAHLLAAAGQEHERAVHVRAVGAAVRVAVELRRVDGARQRGTDEQRRGGQPTQDVLAEAHRQLAAIGQLLVAFDAPGERAGGGGAVLPVGGVEFGAEGAHFILGQDLVDGNQHGGKGAPVKGRAGTSASAPMSASVAQPAWAMQACSSSTSSCSMWATPSAPAAARAYI